MGTTCDFRTIRTGVTSCSSTSTSMAITAVEWVPATRRGGLVSSPSFCSRAARGSTRPTPGTTISRSKRFEREKRRNVRLRPDTTDQRSGNQISVLSSVAGTMRASFSYSSTHGASASSSPLSASVEVLGQPPEYAFQPERVVVGSRRLSTHERNRSGPALI